MKKWYALYVKMHHEKKLSQRLSDKGVEHFLPIQTVVRQWSDRKKKIDQVVIPMMIFVHVEEQERTAILEDSSAISFFTLRGSHKPTVIPDHDMERFMFMFDFTESAIKFCPDTLTPGCRVRVIKGPLLGLEGELVQRYGHHEVGIQIPYLGYATVEIPVGYLLRLDDKKKSF